MFWETSLCKAVAAKKYANLFDRKLADEAFVAGLFQDFAMVVMFATAREQLHEVRNDPSASIDSYLQKERGLFHLDHAEVGRSLAQKLKLPDLFVDAVAFHHNYEKLTAFIEQEVIADAIYVASLFPHVLNVWHHNDADALLTFLQEHATSTEPKVFLEEIQEELGQMYAFFHEGCSPDMNLTDLLGRATREAADNTTQLVGTVNELMRQAAATGIAVNEFAEQHDELEEKSHRDQLTGVLNREGFTLQAADILAKAFRYGTAFAVGYVDIDSFKPINDNFGHEFGDLALKRVATEISDVASNAHLAGRVGGDEFVLLLNECTEKDATQIVERIISNVAKMEIRKRDHSLRITVSVGLLYVHRFNREPKLDVLLNAADRLMYRAKQAGGNQVNAEAIQV